MRIIWAVDPFDTHVSVLSSAARALRALVGSSKGFDVKPVYIWSKRPPAFGKMSKSFLKDLEKRGQEELESAIERIRVPFLGSLEIACCEESSRRAEARALVSRAKKWGADLIVVSSHGKKGIKRALLGSFAETLSLVSEVPLLVVWPGREMTTRHILYPTDFSESSVSAFKLVVSFAKERKSEITVFHKIAMAPFPVLELPLSAAPAYGEYFTEEAKAMELEGKKLVALAARQGVKARIIVDRSSPGSVSETIVRRARKANAIVAITSKSGPVSSLLLGSTARQVLREAASPVWIIHPAPSRKTRTQEPLFELNEREIERELYERPA